MTDYRKIKKPELRKLVSDRGLAPTGRAAWYAKKATLIKALETGEWPEENGSSGIRDKGSTTPGSTTSHDNLAEVIARAVSGYVNSGVDRDQIARIARDITREELGDALPEIESKVKEALEGILPKRLEIVRPNGESVKIDGAHRDFEKVLKWLEFTNVFLVGPAGCGKSTLARQCAEALGVPFRTISVNAQMPLSALFGYMDANGRYVSTEFRRAYEEGGVFLLDEIDCGNANCLTALNQALANRCCPFPDRTVERHSDFHCIAAANTFGNGASRVYVGRNILDGATLDRFAQIEIVYDEEMERAHCADRDWFEYAIKVRRAVEALGLRRIVSTRAILDGGQARALGIEFEEVEKTRLFAGWKSEEINEVKNRIGGKT